jgi:hypothetical protein
MKPMHSKLLLASLVSILAGGSALAGDADFTLVNRTGYTLREVYISPSSKNSWGNDRLGQGYLENGKSRLFKFSDDSACDKDLQVVFDENGAKVVWQDVDVCEIRKITLKYDRSTNTVSADTE